MGVAEYAIRVPGMLSILVSGDFSQPSKASETEVKGLADLPSNEFLRHRHPGKDDVELAKIRPQYWPNVPMVFQTYHLMIAIGVSLTGIALLGCLLWSRGKLHTPQSRLMRVLLLAARTHSAIIRDRLSGRVVHRGDGTAALDRV